MMLSASKIAFMPALALHSAMPSPRRKPKVSLPSLLAAMREISAPRRSRFADDRKMLADRRYIGEQRVGRNAGGDRRKQGNERIERNAGGQRQETVILDFVVSADKDILPTAPGNLRRRARAAAATALDGTDLLQGQWFLRRRRARGKTRRPRLAAAIVLNLETIDDAGSDHHGRGEPGNEIVQPMIADAGTVDAGTHEAATGRGTAKGGRASTICGGIGFTT